MFLEVAAAAKAAGHAVREATARARAAALEPKLPRITIALPEAIAALPGVVVERDEVALEPVVWGTAVPVDLGPHVVRVKAPGKERWETTVQVSALAQDVVLTVPLLADAAAPAPEPQAARDEGLARAPAAPIAGPPIAPPRASMSGQRIAALAMGAAGITAIAAGGVLGLLARSTWKDADSTCPEHVACSRDAHDTSMRALALARGSTGAFIAGGVGIAGGVALWLTAPSRHASARSGLAVKIGGGDVTGVTVTGAF
jgi:hypothetical protein